MAINKKLIHFQTLNNFEQLLSAGNILDTSICFIKDAKKIWTHGCFYDCVSAAYPLINMGDLTLPLRLDPNILYVWDTATYIEIENLEPGNENSTNEYLFQFTSGETPTTLVLPEVIKWTTPPNIQANKIYLISVLNNLGTVLEFSI